MVERGTAACVSVAVLIRLLLVILTFVLQVATQTVLELVATN